MFTVKGKSITAFCAARGYTRPWYYNLKAKGLAPEEVRKLGKRDVIITPQAEAKFDRIMASDEVQRQIAIETMRRRDQALVAARASAASPKHISKRRRVRR